MNLETGQLSLFGEWNLGAVWNKIKAKWTEPWDLWDGIKYPSMCIIDISGGGEVEKEKEYLRNNAWKLNKFEENAVIYTSRNSNMINPTGSALIHITIKWPKTKDKERIFKVGREKWLIIWHIQVILSNISSWFILKNLWSFGSQKAGEWVLEKRKFSTKDSLLGRTLLKNWRY